jgi:hypothetical protein
MISSTTANEIATIPAAKGNLFFLIARKNIGRFTSAAKEITPPNLF